MQLAAERADVYHIQFEYRTFGGVVRSLVILPFVTAYLRLRCPVIVTLHGLVTKESLQSRRQKWAVHLAFRVSVGLTGAFASAFVVHSDDMRAVATAEYGLHDVFVIPLGSDPVPIVGGRHAAAHRVVFFGFIRPEKGIKHLIEAIGELNRDLPTLRLTIAGSIIYHDELGYLRSLREMVSTRGLSETVEFRTKFLPEDEISELMGDASVVVLPYTDRFVEVSAIVHDLAGYGVPLICSDTPRFSELVDGVDCLKVSPVASEIAAAILRIVRNPGLAAKLGDGLLRRAQRESWDVVAATHLELYRHLLGTDPASRLPAD